MADRLHRNIAWAIILAECSHVFCCVLPTIVTLMALLSGVSAFIQVPVFLLDLHDIIHSYEIPIMVFSGGLIVLGWGLYALARRMECERPHCPPHDTVCAPAKSNSVVVLWIATILFLINVTVYFSIHYRFEHAVTAAHETHEHHTHDH